MDRFQAKTIKARLSQDSLQKRRIDAEEKRLSRQRDELMRKREARLRIVPDIMDNDSEFLGELPGTFEECLSLIESWQPNNIHIGLHGIRKIFVSGHQAHEHFCAIPGAVDLVLKCLEYPYIKAQKNAVWCINSITSASTEPTSAVVSAGGIDILMSLLESEESEIALHALWSLGNIAGDIRELRNAVFLAGITEKLSQISLTADCPIQVISIGSWVISNLVRDTGVPDMHAIKVLIEVLERFIDMAEEQEQQYRDEVISNCMWSMIFITNHYQNLSVYIIGQPITRHLLRLAEDESHKISIPAIRTMGNITFGDESGTTFLLDNGLCNIISRQMASPKTVIVKESAWLLSNIAAGTEEHISTIISAGLIARAAELLASPSREIRRECVWAIANASSNGSVTDLHHLIEGGILESLIAFLDNSFHNRDSEVAKGVGLESVNYLLMAGTDMATMTGGQNEALVRAIDQRLPHVLDSLANDPNPEIFNLTETIRTNFCLDDDDITDVEYMEDPTAGGW